MLRELTSIAVGQPRTDPPRLRVAADAVAAFVGAQGRDLVFVDNTTTGVNAVLRMRPWEPGDELLIADHAYGAVAHAARYATRERGAHVRTITLTPPFSAASIADAFEAGVTSRTRLAIVDHISAESALVLPLAEIAARLRARGVLVLADGARTRQRASRLMCRPSAWTGKWRTCTSGRSCRAAAASCGRRPRARRACIRR